MRVYWIVLSILMLGACQKAAKPVVMPEKMMVIVIPSYNNARWLAPNILSVISQKYANYRVIYMDDCSKDGTIDGVSAFLHSQSIPFQRIDFDDSQLDHVAAADTLAQLLQSKFVLVRNVNRCGALANLYRAIHSAKPNEVIVTLDGDDWFAHDQVLADLNKVYASENVWMTHGRLVEYPHGGANWCLPIPDDYIQRNAFREYRCSSHLRTFYAGLFQQIRLEDLLFEGKFFAMTWDQAIMFPMMEMAGERHAFISQVNYVYNMANNLNDNKVDPDLQNRLEALIRNKPRYERLEQLPFDI